MLFSSMIFLWVFLPVVIIGNFLFTVIPAKDNRQRIRMKNGFLLLASLFFYAWGGIYYLLIMLSSILINFTGGQLLAHKYTKKKDRRWCLVIIVALNLLILFVFKYFNMTVIVIENLISDSINGGSILGMRGTGKLHMPQIVLPIGISFFTFQAMSYVIDVYRGDAPVQDHLISFALYVSFFPQLIAGPIVRYLDVAAEINDRKEPAYLRVSGIKRFCYGLGKKVLLANTFAETADKVFQMEASQLSTLTIWLGIICYTLQIYYDFSGYSDMAIGLGRMFGFHFKENFNYPYISQSIREFWRRWHISLSTWFREYVYIPLGGNRKGKVRTYINLFTVFLLTGIWHGANFTFIAWGLYYGVILVVERVFLGGILDRNPIKLINHIYVLLIVVIGWVFFRADNIYLAVSYLKTLFSWSGDNRMILSFLSNRLILFMIAGILLCGPVQKKMQTWYMSVRKSAVIQRIDFVCQICLLVLSILSLVGGTYNPFIYFQF